jgi:hypothetical protein
MKTKPSYPLERPANRKTLISMSDNSAFSTYFRYFRARFAWLIKNSVDGDPSLDERPGEEVDD